MKKGGKGVKGVKGLKGIKGCKGLKGIKGCKGVKGCKDCKGIKGCKDCKDVKVDKKAKDVARLRQWTVEHRKDPAYRAKMRANAAAKREQVKTYAEFGRVVMQFFATLDKVIAFAKRNGGAK